jgi:hypothetical protein
MSNSLSRENLSIRIGGHLLVPFILLVSWLALIMHLGYLGSVTGQRRRSFTEQL